MVLVGAGTVRAEKYNGVQRPTRGRDTPPPVAVVTGTAELDPSSALFTDTVVPPLILTLESAPARRRAAITEAGGEVVVLPRLTPDVLLAELARRGLGRGALRGRPVAAGCAARGGRGGRAVPDRGAAAGRRGGGADRPRPGGFARTADDVARRPAVGRRPAPALPRSRDMATTAGRPRPHHRSSERRSGPSSAHTTRPRRRPRRVHRRRRPVPKPARGTTTRRPPRLPRSRPGRPIRCRSPSASAWPSSARGGVGTSGPGPPDLSGRHKSSLTAAHRRTGSVTGSERDRVPERQERPERGPRGGRWSPACCCASPRCSPGARSGRRSGRPSRCAGRTCLLHPPLRRRPPPLRCRCPRPKPDSLRWSSATAPARWPPPCPHRRTACCGSTAPCSPSRPTPHNRVWAGRGSG